MLSRTPIRHRVKPVMPSEDASAAIPPAETAGIGLPFWVLAVICLWRLCNVGLMQTSFVPDEYWQALEVAHHWVFGYGYLTWEWSLGLRGITHPMVFAGLYRGLQLLGLDSPLAVVHAPLVLQGISGLHAYRPLLFPLCPAWSVLAFGVVRCMA